MSNHVSTATFPTMTSLEMVDYINSQRGEGEAVLRHDHFMAKVPKVLGEGSVPKFRDTHVNPQNGQSYAIYRFPKREACLMAMSYSYDLQAKVFDRMTALEQQVLTRKPASPKIASKQSDAFREASLIAKYNLKTLKMFGVAPKMAVVITTKTVLKETGVDYTPHLAGYIAVDDTPLSPTQLGQLMDGKSAVVVNKYLERCGLQTKDDKGRYILTDAGRAYGTMEPYQAPNSAHVGYRIKWNRKVATEDFGTPAPKVTTDELDDLLLGRA